MQLSILTNIFDKIEKYGLVDEINDIDKWLISLNDKQIENFCKLDIKPSDNFEVFKYALLDTNLLNSDNYIQDINLINNTKTRSRALSLATACRQGVKGKYHNYYVNLVINAKCDEAASLVAKYFDYHWNLLNNPNHLEDLKLIANADKDICKLLYKLSTNKKSLNSKYHYKDMELLSTSKGLCGDSLMELLTNENFLKGRHHIEDIKTFMELENRFKVDFLKKLFKSSNFDCNKYRKKYIDLIINTKNIHQYFYKFCCITDLALLENYYNEKEINMILNAKSDDIALYLTKTIINNKIDEKTAQFKYNDDNGILVGDLRKYCLNAIANAKSNYIAKYLYKIINDDSVRLMPYYKEIIELISNVRIDTIADVIYDIVTWDLLMQKTNHIELIRLISDSKSNTIADCLLYVAKSSYAKTSPYYFKNLQMILNAKSDKIAQYLCDVSLWEYCDSIFHLKDMQMIYDSNDETIDDVYNTICLKYDKKGRKVFGNHIIKNVYGKVYSYVDGNKKVSNQKINKKKKCQ